MARYHLSPKDGQPRVCSARKKCEFADDNNGAGVEHYPNKAEAMKAYEANMSKEHDTFSSMKKNAGEYTEPTEENVDNTIDKIDSNDSEIRKMEQADERKAEREKKILSNSIDTDEFINSFDKLKEYGWQQGVTAVYDTYDDYYGEEDYYDEDGYNSYEDTISYSGDVEINRDTMVNSVMDRFSHEGKVGSKDYLKARKLVEKIMDENDMFEEWSYEVDTNSNSSTYGNVRFTNPDFIESMQQELSEKYL